MPALFAVGKGVVGNPTVALFAAFGSFAMLLMVDFGGRLRDRVQAYLVLAAAGAVLICVGTLVSRDAWVAAPVIFVLAFAVLFSGVVSSVLAGASTSLLMPLILGITTPGSAAAIPDRLLGWGLAAGGTLVAVTLLWPAPAQDKLRGSAAEACRALADRLRAGSESAASGTVGDGDGDGDGAGNGKGAGGTTPAPTEAVVALHTTFLATPYRPTGLSTAARAIVRLVDELLWIDVVLTRSQPYCPVPALAVTTRAVQETAATVLERSADLLDQPGASVTALTSALADLERARESLESEATIDLPVSRRRAPTAPDLGGDGDAAEFVTSLDPAFRAQELSFVITVIARNVEIAVTAEDRTWWQRLLGRQPTGSAGSAGSAGAGPTEARLAVPGRAASARERAAAHVEPHSAWLRNSLRGATALAAAVAVTAVTGVSHSFWVVFGTLSVLRSNALNTGQNAVRGILGTVLGLAVGAALLSAVSTHTALVWMLLPLSVLCAGIAPVLISFTAGQAAFTATMLILFDVIQPVGWHLGVVRLEDVAIGCAVSLVVGTLFWPRGASATLRTALAEAYTESAAYLDEAVAFGATRCDATATQPYFPPTVEASRAAASARRLDDTFRTYLIERGAKPVPLAEMTTLVTGVAALRLTADAILELWDCDQATDDDREAARTELQARSHRIADWYKDLASAFVEPRENPAPLAPDPRADTRLIDSVRRDLQRQDGTATATAVRMIWTADHLDAARHLQSRLDAPARTLRQGEPREASGL